MKNENPLRIFTKEQIDALDSSKLKRYKNDFLAQFKFRGKPIIVVHGEEYSKTDIEEIFDELESSLPVHHFINQNRSFDAFLNKDGFNFLKDELAIQKVKDFLLDHREIEEKIVARLQNLIPKLVSAPNIKNHSKLKTIEKFLPQLNPNLIERTYSKAFDEIKKYLLFIENKFTTPFEDENIDKFHPDLRKHVNLEYYESFDYLPENFKTLAIQYSSWCYNSIVKKSVVYSDEIPSYSKESLYTLRNAASIAAKEFDPQGNNQIVYLIKRQFDRRRKNFSKRTNLVLIVLTMFYVARMIGSFDSCSKRSYERKPYTYTRKAKVETEQEKRTKAEAKKKLAIQKQDLIDHPIRVSKYNISEYSGEKQKGINEKLIKQEEKEGYTELWYDVSVLPSKNTVLKFLIPPELGEKHRGEIWPVVMNFKHPKVKNSTLQHKVFFDFKKEKKIYPQKYIHKKNDASQDEDITLQAIPFENYPLNGAISRVDSENGEVLYSSKFRITYNTETEIYFVKFLPSGKKMSFTQEYVSQMDTEYAIEDYDKFAIAIKNTNLIVGKRLTQSKEYEMSDVIAYTFEEFNKTKFQSAKLVNERAFLKHYITSDKDNTAYVELKGQYVSLKYFVESETGEIKGMTMVNSSESSLGMETMTIFSNKKSQH